MLCFAALLLVLKGIADGYAKAGSAGAAELHIIAHFIEMRFRPDENSRRHIQPDGRAKLPKEVIAAYEIRAPGKGALKTWRIKTNALSSYSSRKLQLGPLAQRRCIHRIHVIEKRPER